MTEPHIEATTDRRGNLRLSVGATVSRLQRIALDSQAGAAHPAVRATLARLRRAAGKKPESDPLAFQEILDLLEPALSESELGRGAAPSPSERAAFNALTLFALHMQSAQSPMHVQGQSFATAAGTLVKRSESKSIKPRFDALLAARSGDARLIHTRSLITLLRGHKIGFDYGQFAADLRTLETPHYSNILLKWGRDFVLGSRADKKSNKTPLAI